MTNPTPEEINAHFEELGQLTFEQEDGRTLGIQMFSCNECGSLIAVRAAHWRVHRDLS